MGTSTREKGSNTMFRAVTKVASASLRSVSRAQVSLVRPAQARFMSGARVESDAEFDARYIAYFDRKDIDGWEIRKGMADLVAMDLVPEPTILAAALRACRRVNDFSLTTRILEITKVKCGDKEAEFWPYIMQELKPTMAELGGDGLPSARVGPPQPLRDPLRNLSCVNLYVE